MTKATVTLIGGMQFAAETGSGHSLVIDAQEAVGGRSTGPRPLELMAVGVAGCTAMDVISILRKMQQKVTGLKVQVTGEQATEFPKKFVSLHVQYTVTGYALSTERVAHAIELSEIKYCPAMASLRPGVPITSGFTVVEATPETLTQ